MNNHAASTALNANIAALRATLDATASLGPALERAADLMVASLERGGQLLAAGNGGSAADALHLTCELVVRFRKDRRAYPAICLAASGADLTAIGNDYAFEQVFARQVEAYGRPGDVLVVLSSSGNSANLRLALEAARAGGLGSVALLGRDGGFCRGLADVDVIVPGDATARIQEAQKLLIHTLCELVEDGLGVG
jgi:D-sedoheptulose 7-phosphate isomerase